jgi:hypothetical protein
MKTILLILILWQFPPLSDNFFTYGITCEKWINTDHGVFCKFQTDKISNYVDLKIKVARETIIGPSAFIFTNAGNYVVQIEPKLNKNGYSIIRLFYRQKELWVGIESGIKRIEFKTNKTNRIINVNDNLNQLKTFTNGK